MTLRIPPADLYSPSEVRAICQVGRCTVRVWAEAGKLPCIRTPGGHRRFPVEAVHAFHEQRQRDRRRVR